MLAKQTTLFVINPISGHAKGKKVSSFLQKYIDTEQLPWNIVMTTHQGHAFDIAREMTGQVENIIAVGGDGTVNEVAAGIIAAQKNANMGIVPLGSGNGLARHLGIPIDYKQAIKRIRKGETQTIDVGVLNDRPFLCTSGIGFDAYVSKLFALGSGRGLFNYIKHSIKAYFSFPPSTYSITIDGKSYEREAYILTIANADQYGNDVIIAPQADIRDGLFHLTLIKPFKKVKGLNIVWDVLSRKIHQSNFAETFIGRDIEITKRGDYMDVHMDGEAIADMSDRLHYRILPRHISIIC